MEIVFLRTCETPFTTRRDFWHQRRKSALTHSWVDTADARRRFWFSDATHTSMTFELEVLNSQPLYKLSLSDVSRVETQTICTQRCDAQLLIQVCTTNVLRPNTITYDSDA